jgi:hypothetical protein
MSKEIKYFTKQEKKIKNFILTLKKKCHILLDALEDESI